MQTISGTALEWLDRVCREFSEATAWRLSFTMAETADSSHVESRLREDARCCWLTEIEDGHDRLGFLHLELPDDAARDRGYLATVQLAEVVAQLVKRLAAANRNLETHSREVRTLMELGRSVPRSADLQGSLDQLLRAAVQLTGFWTSAFFLLNPTAGAFQLRASYHLDALQIPQPQRACSTPSPDLRAIRDGKLVVQHDDPEAHSWLPAMHATGVCVPVHTEAGPLGTLWCYDRRQRRVTDREIHVLQSVAVQLAAVLERTVLLRESESQQRLKRELRVVSERQPGGRLTPLSSQSGLDAAFRAASASEVGGDLCEVIPLSSHQTLVTVGDAVGHSIPAAIIMSVARGALRTLLLDVKANPLHTSRLMQRLNSALHSVTHGEQFMTLVCGVVDSSSLTFSYTNAGHPGPLHIRGQQVTPLASHGLLLGILNETTYERSVLALSPGDLLVFFTDGITEAMSRANQAFRNEGIVRAIQSSDGETAADIADAIWRSVQSHSADRADDQTLLVLKMTDAC